MPKWKDVDAYLEALPEDKRAAIDKLRAVIRSVIPDAVETLSYDIPTFKQGRPVVGYGAFKEHCSLFVFGSTVLDTFAEDLKDCRTSKGTLQFTVDKPLPAALVKRLVKARLAENATKVKANIPKTKKK